MSRTAQRFDGMDTPTAAAIILEGLDRVSGKLGVDAEKAAVLMDAKYDLAAANTHLRKLT